MANQRPRASGANILLVVAAGSHGELRARLDEDHRVIVATDLAQAERALDDESPDLLLIELTAAGYRHGDDLAALLQRLSAADLPVILLGPCPPERVTEALNNGVDDLLEADAPIALALRRIGHQLDMRYCHELLRAQSLLDGLTGLANRNRFDEFLAAAFGDAQRRQESLALVLFDIDAFAAFNAARGHAAGDEVLLHIGRTLASARRRPFDLFARHAGDGFACVLPNTDLAGARAVAELVMADVDALMLDHPDSPVGDCITVSLGIAACTPPRGEAAHLLFDHASAALQRAKRAGRHRISD